jgi:hypothetical protein
MQHWWYSVTNVANSCNQPESLILAQVQRRVGVDCILFDTHLSIKQQQQERVALHAVMQLSSEHQRAFGSLNRQVC